MMMLQATAKVPDYGRLREAFEWLIGQIEHPEGFFSLQVLQAHDDPNRVTMIEWWESVEAFEVAFPKYDMEQRAEFLSRAGINPETFGRTLWLESDIPVVKAGAHRAS